LRVNGFSILTLTGNNTYSGATTISSGGTLKPGAAAGTSPNSIVQVDSRGTLDLGSFDTAIAGLMGRAR